MIKQLAIKLFLFFIFSLIVYSSLIIIWGVYGPENFKDNSGIVNDYGYLNKRISDANVTKNIDILFLGPSTTYRSYDPRIFKEAGYNIFNFGSSAQTPKQTNILIHNYLDKFNPKLIVYDVYPAVLEGDGIEPSLDLIINGLGVVDTYGLVLNDLNIKIFNALIFKSFMEIFSIPSPRKGDVKNDLYIKGGFVENNTTFTNNKPMILSKSNWAMKKNQLEFLDKNIDFINEKEIPLLLVRVPVNADQYFSKSNNESVDSLFRAKGDFKNFQNSIKLSDSLDFKDVHHLNKNGAIKFDLHFIDYLKKNYKLD